MKTGRDLDKLRESPVYQAMFKDIIKNQIQNLMGQLSNAGEESVLLTACITDTSFADESVLGSDLGRSYLHDHSDVVWTFRDYCSKKIHKSELTASQNLEQLKRKLESEMNGEQIANSELQTPDAKRPKIDLQVKVEPETDTQVREVTPAKLNNELVQNFIVPKGHHKCSICSYMSKFKANVVRHERSVHGINLDGVQSPSVQYVCTLCTYKSLYRSNMIRHEKTVHKLDSTRLELESRKIPIDQSCDNHTLYLESSELDADGCKMVEQNDNIETVQENTMYSEYNESIDDSRGADVNFTCHYCQIMCDSHHELKKHVDNVHFSTSKFECEKCGKKFSNLINLHGHMAMHNAKQLEKCACGKTFQYRTSLRRHTRRCEFAVSSLDEIEQGTSEQDLSQLDSESIQEKQETSAGDATGFVENILNSARDGTIETVTEVYSPKEIQRNKSDENNVKMLDFSATKQE